MKDYTRVGRSGGILYVLNWESCRTTLSGTRVERKRSKDNWARFKLEGKPSQSKLCPSFLSGHLSVGNAPPMCNINSQQTHCEFVAGQECVLLLQ